MWNEIRKYFAFMLLFTLNARVLYEAITGDKSSVLLMLCVVFSLFAFDYKAITKEYICVVSLIFIAGVIGQSLFLISVLTILLLMQCVFFLGINTYLRYSIIILGISAAFMYLSYGIGKSYFDGIDLLDRSDRFDFGFVHPNTAAMYYYGLFMSLLLFVGNDPKYKKYLPVLFIVVGLLFLHVYKYTLSRSFLLSILIFIIVYSYYTIRERISCTYRIGFSKYLLLFLPFLFFFITIFFTYEVDDYPLLNLFFSGRLSYYNEALSSMTAYHYIFGATFDEDIILDSSYIQMIIQVGVLLALYFLWLYCKAMKNIIQQQNILLIAFIVSILSYGLTEALILIPGIIGNNLLLVLLFKYRYETDPFFNKNLENLEMENN